MKKLLSIFLFLSVFQQYGLAEVVAGWDIPSTYLDNGKLKVSQSATTPFNVNVSFTRYFDQGTNTWETVDIQFKIVVLNSANGQIVTELKSLTNITTNDFPSQGTTITKNYSLNITYSSLGIPAQNVRVALLWKSSRNAPPSGYPNGLWVFNPQYQVTVVTPPTSPVNNKFAVDDVTGLAYWGVEGQYRLIFYRSEYELFGSNYQTYVNNNTVHFSGLPSPLGQPLGWETTDDTYANAFLIKKDNILYFVEVKLINPSNPDATQIYYYCRKVSDEIKTYYNLIGTSYMPNFSFSPTPVVNGYVLGPDLGY